MKVWDISANRFLKEKGLISLECDKFVIKFEDGKELSLEDLLNEFLAQKEEVIDNLDKLTDSLLKQHMNNRDNSIHMAKLFEDLIKEYNKIPSLIRKSFGAKGIYDNIEL